MASIEDLKSLIDLHDLAEKLGLERPQGRGNYKSPHHDDKAPSLSIYADGKRWKDHSSDNAGGTCIDLVCYVRDCEVGEALRLLHEWYGLPMDRPETPERRRQKSRAEFIADKVLADPGRAREYLQERGIVDEAIDRAIKHRTLGFNTWHSDQIPAGQVGHGGDGVAFVVRSLNPGQVVAVDMRYLDPEQNGGLKTQTQGDKAGAPWTANPRALEGAQVVYIVESPINALSVDSCSMPGTVALATRGTQTIDSIDWSFLQGKAVRICMDYDRPDDKGRCAGQDAAWKLYHVLAWHGISAMLVEQYEWPDDEFNDINDVILKLGPEETRRHLKKLDPYLIPGMHQHIDRQVGKPRVWLPPHDLRVYGLYRVTEDFTQRIDEVKEDGETREMKKDVCGFRVVDISRVRIASAKSVMTGETDYQPTTLFAVTVQEASHGKNLQRRVFTPERLYNVEHWKKLGFVYNQGHFTRMVNVLSRTVELGSHDAVNFVGLAWRDARPIVNQGPDCYFTEPEKQCPYHNLVFPRGMPAQGARVVEAYQQTFTDNAATLCLVWGLGAHLKAFLGFWPHFVMEAEKGAGKSTLIKRLESSLAFIMFSRTQMETPFRTVTSTSHTFHPVGWEEISAGKQDIIDKAVSTLQETYNYTIERRGSDMTEFVKCAPVLLAGEDVPVKTLTGKLIRTQLHVSKQGPMIEDNLPAFPVRDWLDYLAGFTKAQVKERYRKAHEYCTTRSSATGSDGGARRMVENYAAVLCAWGLLCDFMDLERDQGRFPDHLVREMNQHINETSTDREPWVWIVETLLSEISSNNFQHPYCFMATRDNQPVLAIRPSHIMDHLHHTHRLRQKSDSIPIKSARVLKRQMSGAGVLVESSSGPVEVEKTINSRREAHLLLLNLDRLAQYGLYASIPENLEDPGPGF